MNAIRTVFLMRMSTAFIINTYVVNDYIHIMNAIRTVFLMRMPTAFIINTYVVNDYIRYYR